MKNRVVIVSAVRTPIGSFLGGLSSVSATKLGAIAIKGALKKIDLTPTFVDEVLMGNVLQANLGQAPAKQAALLAGIPNTVPCTTINKVCASGMKAIMQAAQAIQCGDAQIVIAGGMENMSQVPHYLNGRSSTKFGNLTAVDGLLKDGLTNVYDQQHMGVCADLCATDHHISRVEQDAFAKESYLRSAKAWEEGKFEEEIIPVEVPQRKGAPILITEDEEYKKINFEKVSQLRPAFSPNGTVTAANASTLNDGAAALVIMSEKKAKELNLTPLAFIRGYADASDAPEKFTTAPAQAIPKALQKANIPIEKVDYFELNEAFSVVGIANCKLLHIATEKTNINGGAVSLGHPLGCSGARIVVSLLHILHQQNATIGAAGICNGGGGASAIIIEKNIIG
ncbi:acetyl-CoA C-acyltransferase [Flavicella sediminum]|uniref:acetyl-CoA C-acyltransferase n=1 Tax=Flavicella sediminum TaxID=2585141 RepID=UPI00111D07F6|nr:acetyl-CoA C-acyltransferase [Flavicella sediminum]